MSVFGDYDWNEAKEKVRKNNVDCENCKFWARMGFWSMCPNHDHEVMMEYRQMISAEQAAF